MHAFLTINAYQFVIKTNFQTVIAAKTLIQQSTAVIPNRGSESRMRLPASLLAALLDL